MFFWLDVFKANGMQWLISFIKFSEISLVLKTNSLEFLFVIGNPIAKKYSIILKIDFLLK